MGPGMKKSVNELMVEEIDTEVEFEGEGGHKYFDHSLVGSRISWFISSI